MPLDVTLLVLLPLLGPCLSFRLPLVRPNHSPQRQRTFASDEQCANPASAHQLTFRHESVIRMHHAQVKPLVWIQWLAPNVLLHGSSRGVDTTVFWSSPTTRTSEEASATAARELMQATLPVQTPSRQRQQMQDDVLTSMQSFQEFCREQRDATESNEPLSFSARLVSSRGRVGAKCPLWHVDHVSYRWIQALAGPGCIWISNAEAVRWDQFFSDTTDSARDHHHPGSASKARHRVQPSNEEKNQRLVDTSQAVMVQSKEGEGVVMFGNKNNHPQIYPTVHKSPEIAVPWQGRVLLTLNVVHRQ